MAAATAAVRDGCRATADLQAALGPEDRQVKGDNSPVTVADYVAQVIVMYRLREALGEQPVMAEESADLLLTSEAARLARADPPSCGAIRTDARMSDPC